MKKSNRASLDALMTTCRAQMTGTTPVEKGSDACLELFRRAVDDGNEDAWTFIQSQYRVLVARWVRQAAQTPLELEDAADLTQDAFLKFISTLGREKETIGRRFDHIGAVLAYLRRCATTACIDFHRRQSRHRRAIAAAEELAATPPQLPDEAQLARLAAVRRWLAETIQDEDERLVIHHAFHDGWPPKKIQAHYPQRFADVETVRRIKLRILRRAKRKFRP